MAMISWRYASAAAHMDEDRSRATSSEGNGVTHGRANGAEERANRAAETAAALIAVRADWGKGWGIPRSGEWLSSGALLRAVEGSGCGLRAAGPSPSDEPRRWGSGKAVCVSAGSWRLCARSERASTLGVLVVSSGARVSGGEGRPASSTQYGRGGQQGKVSGVTGLLELLGWGTTGCYGL